MAVLLVNSHIDLCIALVEDVLKQFQQPANHLCDENVLDGLVVACESLLSYCVELERVVSSHSLALQQVVSSAARDGFRSACEGLAIQHCVRLRPGKVFPAWRGLHAGIACHRQPRTPVRSSAQPLRWWLGRQKTLGLFPEIECRVSFHHLYTCIYTNETSSLAHKIVGTYQPPP